MTAMAFRNIRKKRDSNDTQHSGVSSQAATNPVPEFTFLRTTTNTQEVIQLPNFEDVTPAPPKQPEALGSRIASRFRRKPNKPEGAPSISPSSAAQKAQNINDTSKAEAGLAASEANGHRRLSQRLHLRQHSRSRSREKSSEFVPADLPSMPVSEPTDKAAEAKWEKRATMLASGEAVRSRSASMNRPTSSAEPAPIIPQIQGLDNKDLAESQSARDDALQRPEVQRSISDAEGDVSLQEAIRLHDSGTTEDLQKSTEMFGVLADPDGANNALAQVLYGLALRHGWGVESQPKLALTYLTTAASNSAAVESAALTAGSVGGGAAKGELVLAIYELANSFRHGWGVEKDAVAARQYYETAANLGDVDAMVETATCYLQGIGGPKDKWRAAQYLRRAEKGGKRSVGESWIWKDKYNDPPPGDKKSKKDKK